MTHRSILISSIARLSSSFYFLFVLYENCSFFVLLVVFCFEVAVGKGLGGWGVGEAEEGGGKGVVEGGSLW